MPTICCWRGSWRVREESIKSQTVVNEQFSLNKLKDSMECDNKNRQTEMKQCIGLKIQEASLGLLIV